MKKKHPEHVNHERWLVSYADFITLLFAFFVVLFASGQSDKHKQAKLSQAIESAFAHDGIFDAHAKVPPLSESEAPPRNTVPAALAVPGTDIASPSNAHTPAASPGDVSRAVEQVIRHEIALRQLDPGMVTLHMSPEGLVLSLREAGFFPSGSASLRPAALPVFRALAAALPDQPMRIEGHTDDVPIHTDQFTSNWELSTARAATITRLLLAETKRNPATLCAAGFAEFRPAASNATEQGRAQNRRVDLVLLNHSSTTAPERR